MTKDDYNNLLLLQGGRCAICGNLPQENSYLAVDHNHITHKPRGLLCTLCNLGLAAIERDGFVERATDYLGVYTDANKERVDQASTTKASQRTTKPARKSRARSSQVKGGVEPAPDILPGQLSYIAQSESTNNGDSAGGSHQ